MKTKLRLFCKACQLIFLFALGVALASMAFPVIDRLMVLLKAKHCKDRIKQIWLQIFGRILGLKISVEGYPVARPKFLVSNHISWVDIIVLGQKLPGCFVAKCDILTWPVIGFMSRKANTIFIRRGDKRQILQTAECITWHFQQQGNVMAFPEGTTTAGEEVLGFHASLFQSALRTCTPIQPVALKYYGDAAVAAPFVGDDEFLPHLLKMLTLEKIEVTLKFLPAIDGTHRHRNDVSAEARMLIAEAVSHGRRSLAT